MTNEITEKLAAAIGKTAEETSAMLEGNPRLKKLLSEMSEQDAQKLISVLSDKDNIARILSTPQAKTIMEGMNRKGRQ